MAKDANAGSNTEPRTGALRLDISNFGPISKGKINLGPLTILMGPSNSGKSYAATLIYAFLSSHAEARHGLQPLTRRRQSAKDRGAALHPSMQKLMRKGFFTIPAAQANHLAGAAFAPIWKDAIEHSFGSPITDLIRIKQKTAKITVAGSELYEIRISGDVKISVRFDKSTAHKVKIAKAAPNMISDENEENARVLCVDEAFRTASPEFVARSVSGFLLRSLVPRFGDSHYLPAARSGMLQGHRALATSLMQYATRAGADRLEIPRLTKSASEFMTELINVPDKLGSFAALSEDLERGLLGGSIGLSRHNEHSAPDIVYRLPNGDVPLHRTSSTVSEMAPLSLYLKHIVRKNDLLIIEEPEAHLHLSHQIVFAKYVARMIRQGINLLITTHSFALMESLNNYLIAGDMDPRSRRKAGIDKGDYLLSKEVSPHLFSKDDKGGHVIAPMEMDGYGISLEEFNNITDPHYDLGIEMDTWVARNES